jgi:hypothetical protein
VSQQCDRLESRLLTHLDDEARNDDAADADEAAPDTDEWDEAAAAEERADETAAAAVTLVPAPLADVVAVKVDEPEPVVVTAPVASPEVEAVVSRQELSAPA